MLVRSDLLDRTKMIVMSIILVAIAAVSWIFNLGWLRLIMTMLFIPVIHAVVFFLTNLFLVPYIKESKCLKALHLLFCISYLPFYIFLPDFGDYGGYYYFFGLIRDGFLIDFAVGVSLISALLHIVMFVMIVVLAFKIKKKRSANTAA